MSALAFSMLLVRAARTHAIRHVRDAAIHGAQPAQGAAISPFITLACSQAPAPAPVTAREASEWAFWSVNRYTLVYITGAVLTAVVILVTHFFFLEYPNECVSLGIPPASARKKCARDKASLARARSKANGAGAKSAGDLALAIAEERWRRMPDDDRAAYRRVQAYFALLFCMDGVSQARRYHGRLDSVPLSAHHPTLTAKTAGHDERQHLPDSGRCAWLGSQRV